MATRKTTPGKKTSRSSKVDPAANVAAANPIVKPVVQGVKPSEQVAAIAKTESKRALKTEATASGNAGKIDTIAKPGANKNNFGVHNPDPRKNFAPTNLEDEIRRRAYELFQQRAPGSGSEAEDWLTAEREVTKRYHQQSA
jgi:hypothetical protein